MDTDWRKLGLFLAGIGSLYVFFVSVAADFAQVFSLKHGRRLLFLLFIAALGYKGWEQVHRFWQDYRFLEAKLKEEGYSGWRQSRVFWQDYLALRDNLEKARDFITRSAGDSNETVLLCARTLWLFQQQLLPRQSVPVLFPVHMPGRQSQPATCQP